MLWLAAAAFGLDRLATHRSVIDVVSGVVVVAATIVAPVALGLGWLAQSVRRRLRGYVSSGTR